MKFRISPRLALLIIAALFFLPLALAWLMYSGVIEFRPQSTRNLGQLVQPPLPVSWEAVYLNEADGSSAGEAFAGHWLVLHAVPRPCAETCRNDIAGLRQVHRAAGRQQSRIRLALLHDFDDAEQQLMLQSIYGVFQLLRNPDKSLWQMLEDIAQAGEPAAPARGSTFLIDPLGNIMLFYAAGYDPNDLKSDLKRLLTWSKLDEQS